MATSAEIQAKIDKLEINMDRLNSLTNGADTATVTVDSGTVPTIRKFMKDLDTATNVQVNSILSQAQTAATLSQRWAEGTPPGAPTAKSSKDWSAIAQAAAASVSLPTPTVPDAGKAIVVSPAGAYVLSNILSDLWVFQPLGSLHYDPGVTGWVPPPTNRAYRYIELTSGLSGAGGYNSGVLTSESVTGALPALNATAVINLAGSPFNGQTVRLLNTERRFLRSGPTSGTLEDSQNASHTHTGATSNDGSHTHEMPVWTGATGTLYRALNVGGITTNQFGTVTTQQSGGHIHQLIINSQGGDEARPRNMHVRVYMRIL